MADNEIDAYEHALAAEQAIALNTGPADAEDHADYWMGRADDARRHEGGPK